MKLSEIIQSLLADYPEQPLAIGTIVQRTEEHGFGLICGLLTLPLILPIPIPLVGFSTLLGAGIILAGLQLALGYHQPLLPRFIARIELSPAISRTVLGNLNRLLHPVERLAQTRLQKVSFNWMLRRLVGLCLAWNALLMALPLPIPFTNMLPAYTILFLSIGILESDGLLLLLGYGLTGATTAFFASIAGLVWAGAGEVWAFFVRYLHSGTQ